MEHRSVRRPTARSGEPTLAELYRAEGRELTAHEERILSRITFPASADLGWLPSDEAWYTSARSSVGDFPAYVLIRCPVLRMWGLVTESAEEYRDEPFAGAHPVLRRTRNLAESQWSALLDILGSGPAMIGLWEGYGGLTAQGQSSWRSVVGHALGLPRAAQIPLQMSRLPAAVLSTDPVHTPDRGFYFFRSTLPAFYDFLSWREDCGAVCFPDFVEAADWRAACDVDAACVVIGCSVELSERLVAAQGLWAEITGASADMITDIDEGIEGIDPVEGEDVPGA